MKLKKESIEIDLIVKSEKWSETDLADFRTLMQKLKSKNKKISSAKVKRIEQLPAKINHP